MGMDQETNALFGEHQTIYRAMFGELQDLTLEEIRAQRPDEGYQYEPYTRGSIEYAKGFFAEAVEDLLLSNRPLSNKLIDSYLHLGDRESAAPLIAQRKRQHQIDIDAGMVFTSDRSDPIEINAMRLALFDGDVERAIEHLESIMAKGFIFGRKIFLEPLYQPLRDHPKWPVLLKESKSRGEVQRRIYFQLVADDPEVSLPESLLQKYDSSDVK